MNAEEVPIGKKEKDLDKMKLGILCDTNYFFSVGKLREDFFFFFFFFTRRIRDETMETNHTLHSPVYSYASSIR